MKKLLPFPVALFAILPYPATAQTLDATSTLTVQAFREACAKGMLNLDGAFCIGYISGITHMMVANAVAAERFSALRQVYTAASRLCNNSKVTPSGGAATQAFLNWSERHPERWADAAPVGVMLALSETWPCALSN